MEFSKKLQKLRKQNNWTQEQLSEKLYISRTAVSKWESGKGYPNLDSLKDIAKLFNISIDELLSGAEIINIAKYDRIANDKKIINLIFGLLDIISVLLIFLPLYPYKIENIVYSVSLIYQNDVTNVIKIVYIVTLSILSFMGLVELLLFFVTNQKMQKMFNIISFVLHIISTLFYAISKQPYLTSIMLILISIKALITLKYFLHNQKTVKSNFDTKSVREDD